MLIIIGACYCYHSVLFISLVLSLSLLVPSRGAFPQVMQWRSPGVSNHASKRIFIIIIIIIIIIFLY